MPAEVPLEASTAPKIKWKLIKVTYKGSHLPISLYPYVPPLNHLLFTEATSPAVHGLIPNSLCLENEPPVSTPTTCLT